MKMEDDELFCTACDVWRAEGNSVSALPAIVDEGTFCRLVRLIAKCRGKVLLSGCGTSAAAAKKIAHSLCCVERAAVFLSPSDGVHGGLGLLQGDDILILISKGGNTAELLPLVKACRAKGAMLAAVSERADSQLSRAADVFLHVKVEREPDAFNMLATASTLAVIAVFDALCIALMSLTDYTRAQFAVIHPGGAVGDRLLGPSDSEGPARMT